MTTLRNELKKYTGKVVKVGMASSFIYIHKVDDETENDIAEINRLYLEQLKVTARLNENLLNGGYRKKFLDRIEKARKAKLNKWIYEGGRKKAHYSKEQISEAKRLLSMSPEKIEDHIKSKEKIFSDRKKDFDYRMNEELPMLDREVKEVYKALDPGTTIIIVEGKEEGRFWFKSEFDLAKSSGHLDGRGLGLWEGEA